jgi:hypothetical protein
MFDDIEVQNVTKKDWSCILYTTDSKGTCAAVIIADFSACLLHDKFDPVTKIWSTGTSHRPVTGPIKLRQI